MATAMPPERTARDPLHPPSRTGRCRTSRFRKVSGENSQFGGPIGPLCSVRGLARGTRTEADVTDQVPNYDATEWQEQNERLRSLARRALWHYDSQANREIMEIFEKKITFLAMGAPAEQREDITQALHEHLILVLRTGLDHAEALKAYTIQALRNRYLELLEQAKMRTGRDIAWAEGLDVPDMEAHLDLEEAALSDLMDGTCRGLLDELGRRARSKSRTDELVVMLLRLRYIRPELTDVEACLVLGFCEADSKTIREKLSRLRAGGSKKQASELSNLFREFFEIDLERWKQSMERRRDMERDRRRRSEKPWPEWER